VYEISPGTLNRFAPNSHGRRVWSLAWTSLKVKVKGQGHQGQKRYFLPLCWPACGLCLVKHLSKPLVWLLFVEIVIALQMDVYVTQMTLSFVGFWTRS